MVARASGQTDWSRLAGLVPGAELDTAFDRFYKPVGLHDLKHAFDLSDEDTLAR